MIATIETYFPLRGFGFCKITSADGIRTNIFFHIKDVISGDPTPGAHMECDLAMGSPKGPVAKNIRISTEKNGGAA